MIPVLGKQFEIDIEVISKPKSDCIIDEYFGLDHPVARAAMADDEILAEGRYSTQA